MSRPVRWVSSILIFMLVVGWGSSLVKQSSIQTEIEKLTASSQAFDNQVKDKNHELEFIASELTAAQDELTIKNDLAEQRIPYGESLAKASEVLASAVDKVDTTEDRRRILESQNKVLAAEKAEQIIVEITVIKDLTKSITDKIAAYDAEQARLAAENAAREQANRSYSNGASDGGEISAGGDWFSQMRSILDSVGGSWVPLKSFDEVSCGGISEYACTYSTGTIVVGPAIANWSYSRKQWAMAHELAHVFQFQVWDTLVASGSYANLFGSNPETLANCMAAVKGYYSSCSGAQMDFSRSIWNGSVPG